MTEYRVGLAYGVVVFFASLILGAALLAVANGPVDQLLGFAANKSTSQASQAGIETMAAAWDALPFVIVSFATLGLVVRATRESRRP